MALDEFSFNPFGDATPRWLKGSAAPTSGTFYVGDVVWNSTPTAGGTLCWVCTTGGATGGTWKAVAIAA